MAETPEEIAREIVTDCFSRGAGSPHETRALLIEAVAAALIRVREGAVGESAIAVRRAWGNLPEPPGPIDVWPEYTSGCEAGREEMADLAVAAIRALAAPANAGKEPSDA